MKMKLTTLLFGLLLAVGWTGSAFAQNSPNNIPDAVYSAQSLANKTYSGLMPKAMIKLPTMSSSIQRPRSMKALGLKILTRFMTC